MKNMFEEAVCKSRAFALKLGVRLPLMNAPMSDAAGPELAAAVSNAGGLGVLGAGFMSGAEIEQAVARVRSLTDKPFAVVWLWSSALRSTTLGQKCPTLMNSSKLSCLLMCRC